MGKTPLGAKRKATLSFLLGGMTQMSTVYRGVVPGVAGGTMADQTYLNREGQIIPTILLLAPPDFQTFLRSWYRHDLGDFGRIKEPCKANVNL